MLMCLGPTVVVVLVYMGKDLMEFYVIALF